MVLKRLMLSFKKKRLVSSKKRSKNTPHTPKKAFITKKKTRKKKNLAKTIKKQKKASLENLKKKTSSGKIKGNVKPIVVGTISHYFPKVRAAVVKLKVPLALGEKIKIKGHTTDFTQSVNSMQINRVPIKSAKKGQEIGLLVSFRVRRKDVVYKI
jgi:putative protease